MRRTLTIVTATTTVAAVALLAGCGSSGSSPAAAGTTTEAATTTTPAPSPTSTVGDIEREPTTSPAATAPGRATAVAVTMGTPGEFSMSAAPAGVKAGKVRFDVTNKGTILHEMVVVPGASAAALRQADGSASEKGSPGEVPDVEPGADGTITIDLPAGKYVLLCNLPGHFAGGMYTTFTVS